jgi:photosystem II stability/assembly factor-like uncharacterized protein
MKIRTLFITISLMLMVMTAKSQMWLTQNVNPIDTGFNFTCLSVVDSNIIAGIGVLADPGSEDHGYISRSINGGTNWSSTALDTDWWATSFQALSADTMWISTISLAGLSFAHWHTAISKSIDGGQTWTKNTTIPYDTSSYCDFMHFFNSHEGVAFGDPLNGNWQVFYTTNGGITWNPADSIPAPLSGEAVFDNSFFQLGDNIWAASSKGRIFLSHDKGHKWHAATVGTFSLPIVMSIVFFNTLEGLAVFYNINSGLIGYVYRTHDGGLTWTQIPYTGTFYQSWRIGGLFVVPGSNIVIANGGGSAHYGSAYSSDMGATWIKIDSTRRYGAIDGNGWNSLWAGQYSNTLGLGGIAKWDGSFLSIKELIVDDNFTEYPNPATNSLTFETAEKAEIAIFNMKGQVIKRLKTKESKTDIDISDLVRGVYIIEAMTDKGIVTKKFIKD